MGETVVVGLTHQDSVRRCFRQQITPLKQTPMGIQRIVTLALNRENRAAEFVL
jgi:hypothetical protein